MLHIRIADYQTKDIYASYDLVFPVEMLIEELDKISIKPEVAKLDGHTLIGIPVNNAKSEVTKIQEAILTAQIKAKIKGY